MEFPVISMKLLEDDRHGEERTRFALACEQWDCFQLIDHGVPKETMDAIAESLKAYFELPPEAKEKEPDAKQIKRKPVYDNKGVPLVSTHKLGYNKEGVAVFCIEKLFDEPLEEQKHCGWVENLLLPCRPVVDNLTVSWPEKPDGLKEKIECYVKEMQRLGEKIAQCLAINLGLEPDTFVNAFGGRDSVGMMTLVNCMPPTPPGAAALAGPRHRDGIGLTMLQVVDGLQGFQVWKDGQWWSVPWINPYSLLVNVGDLLQIISNDRYKSVVHRGLNCSETMRVSIASTYTPNMLAKIRPVSSLIDEQHPCLYGEGTHADFFEAVNQKPMTSFQYFSSLKQRSNVGFCLF